MRHIPLRALAAVAVICSASLSASQTDAHSALAYGTHGTVAEGGLALGYSYNYSTKGEADSQALQQCLSYMDAPAETRAACKLVSSFDNQCLAVALDPNAGTEGFGWSVSSSLADAKAKAMRECRDTDGPEHADACQISGAQCDTTN